MIPPLRIANCSGFYGDRLSAAKEMVEGGPVDVLTGDWLAELTMLILAKNRMRDPKTGYARTFVTQMEQVMGTCLDRGIKVVANAGGLNPAGCAAAVAEVAERLGLAPSIAFIEGDDLVGRMADLRRGGLEFENLDTGEPLGDREVLTANAYTGCWGIVEALSSGADIVITGRTTDAAVVLGPAAWHHGWARDDWDRLAGGVVAGHAIECGPQVTGGNYSFFHDVPGLEHPGFPIAEIADDGSSVITKHDSHGGAVSVGTVTAQLLYEIGGPRYLNPDVVARFDTIRLSQDAPDRVRITGVRGEPAPATTKVCINYLGGYRSTATVFLTGLHIEAKAALAEKALWAGFSEGKARFDEVNVQLIRTDHADPETNDGATAQLRITVKDADDPDVGRLLSTRLTELALASYPGFYGGHGAITSSYGVYWPALIPAGLIRQEVVVGSVRTIVEPTRSSDVEVNVAVPAPPSSPMPDGPTRRVPLGLVAGARSGDKGGNANVGLWVHSHEAFGWLSAVLTVDRFKQLVPEAAHLRVDRFDLPNIRSLNFVIVGLLGEGVASSTRIDAQAKSLGEFVRARFVEVPVSLLSQ
jgi:hypothetical protein